MASSASTTPPAATSASARFPTYGIGPHEAILLSDGKTLAVANGGIETHIETGREKLNLDSMQPSLAFVDSTTGRLISQHMQGAGLHKLSIRHLAQDARGAVWFGCQWEGVDAETPELVGCAGIDQALRIIEPSKPMGAELAGYIGAVALSGDGRLLAASAPRAGRIVYIDTERFAVVGETHLLDSCGVTGASPGGFAMSSGMGVLQSGSARSHASDDDDLPRPRVRQSLADHRLKRRLRRGMRRRPDDAGATVAHGGARRCADRDAAAPLVHRRGASTKPQTMAIST